MSSSLLWLKRHILRAQAQLRLAYRVVSESNTSLLLGINYERSRRAKPWLPVSCGEIVSGIVEAISRISEAKVRVRRVSITRKHLNGM